MVGFSNPLITNAEWVEADTVVLGYALQERAPCLSASHQLQERCARNTQPLMSPNVILAHSLPFLSRAIVASFTRDPFGNDAIIFPAGSDLTFSGVPVGSSTLHDNADVGLPSGFKIGVDGNGAGLFDGGGWASVALETEKSDSAASHFATLLPHDTLLKPPYIQDNQETYVCACTMGCHPKR